ncbi:MAG TPA: helix-turn-helix domain-containing protein [Acidimicrobiales bacterium]|jgi:DNA-binding IclR family transcriptional regulator|nr:helix-turn-helix domain-containing protein [Acidimicrobiales bacterium]
MAAPVPAVERANRLLTVMADSPRARFTAAELASALRIHRSSCFSLLSCLTELDLVHRDPIAKTYCLGPGLLRLGAAAADHYPAIWDAKREMYALAQELDVGGLICASVDGDMVILDRVGSDDQTFAMPSVDHVRAPLAPPIGAIFVAWSSPEAIQAWMERAPSTASAADTESYLRSVAAVRARGFSIGSEIEVKVQLEEVLGRLRQNGRTERLAAALELADLVRLGLGAPDGEASRPDQAIDHLIGPIFDRSGQVYLTVTIFGRPGQIQGTNLSDYAEPLMAACARVTRSVSDARMNATPLPTSSHMATG